MTTKVTLQAPRQVQMKDEIPEELQMNSSTQIYEVFKSTINFQSEVAPQVDFTCDLGQVSEPSRPQYTTSGALRRRNVVGQKIASEVAPQVDFTMRLERSRRPKSTPLSTSPVTVIRIRMLMHLMRTNSQKMFKFPHFYI